MIDSQNLTRWLAMLYEIDSQLSQLSQVSTLEDRKRLDEAVSYLRLAGIALLEARGLVEPALQKPYLRVIQGGRFNQGAPF
jgi:hypothetical protein